MNMVLQYTHLPLELWMNILDKVDPVVQLGECRLVSRKWDDLAEAIMFSRNIYISGEGNVVKLYNHLVRKPSRAHFIRSLEVYVPPHERLYAYNLLEISFTPTMRNLTILAGSAMDTEFFGLLYGIVKGSPEGHYNLETMPLTLDSTDDNYTNAVLAFKHTLRYLQTSYKCSALNTKYGKLSEFKKLETLELEAEPFEDIFKLDAILKNCKRLKSLELFHRNGDRHAEQNASRIANWARHTVDKVNSLTHLRISYAYPDLIQYLTFKYPNIEDLHCTMANTYHDDDFQSVMDAINTLPQFQIQFLFEDQQLLDSAITTICQKTQSAGLVFQIEYSELLREDLLAELHLAIHNTLSKDVFLTVCIADTASHQAHQGIINSLQDSIGSTQIHHLSIDLLGFRRWPPRNHPEEPITFYDIVDNLPALEKLYLTTDRIEYEPTVASSEPIERRLQALTISYAIIDTKVFPQISQFYPTLDLLRFESCTTLDEQQRDNMIKIDMPFTKVLQLDLENGEPYLGSTGDFEDHIASMIHKSRAFADAYIKVSLLDSDTQLYWKLNTSSPPLPLSANEYDFSQEQGSGTCISITCASLHNLTIYLSDLQVHLRCI